MDDTLAITFNRLAHGYSYYSNPLFDGEDAAAGTATTESGHCRQRGCRLEPLPAGCCRSGLAVVNELG